jgi:type II secretion system protein N
MSLPTPLSSPVGSRPPDAPAPRRFAFNLASWRRNFWRRFAISTALGLLFSTFFWVSLPRRALAWRIAHEARAVGFLLDVEDVWVSPFGAVVLRDVTWNFAPTHPEQVPVPFVVDTLRLDVSMWRWMLFGELRLDVDGVLDEGHLVATYARSDAETRIALDLEELPLYGVPKLQQSVGAPVRGEFSMHVDLTVPENAWSKASGIIEFDCTSCRIGDGQTKLYIAKSGTMLEQGVTVPEIELGTLVARFDVTEGVAVAEEFVAESDDITLKLSGRIEMKDPLKTTNLNLALKLLFKETLQSQNENIRLLVATASKSSKLTGREEGWLGFKVTGTLGSPQFRGFNAKTREDKLREAEERRAQRERAREKAAKEREARKAAGAGKATAPTREQPTDEPDAAGSGEGEKAFIPEPATAEVVPAAVGRGEDDANAEAAEQPAEGQEPEAPPAESDDASAPQEGGAEERGEAGQGNEGEQAPSGETGEASPPLEQ